VDQSLKVKAEPSDQAVLVTGLAVSTCGGVMLVAMQLGNWYLPLGGRLGLFVLTLAAVFISLCFSVVFTWSYRGRGLLSLTPWAINGACLALVWSGVIHGAQVRFNFERYLPAREQLVRLIERGELRPLPDKNGRPQQYGYWAGLQIALPSGYEATSHLDWGLRVWERDGALHVLFVVQRAMFAGFQGFIFRSDDQPPVVAPKAVHGDRFHSVRAMAPHWWWVTYGE
jgi:hypothetical protein